MKEEKEGVNKVGPGSDCSRPLSAISTLSCVVTIERAGH